jgi:hypothetical protein
MCVFVAGITLVEIPSRASVSSKQSRRPTRREQTTPGSSRKQTPVGSRQQQAADSRQQVVDSREQAADGRQPERVSYLGTLEAGHDGSLSPRDFSPGRPSDWDEEREDLAYSHRAVADLSRQLEEERSKHQSRDGEAQQLKDEIAKLRAERDGRLDVSQLSIVRYFITPKTFLSDMKSFLSGTNPHC